MSASLNLNDRNYKELQEIAKSCRIPANIRREQLLKAIRAHYEKDEKILQEVLSEVKAARAKRKKAKMATARPRRKICKDNNSIDGSDDNVDSTSGGPKDVVPYNQYGNSGVDQSYLDRLYHVPHSAYTGNPGQCDSRQPNYVASSSAMSQYNGLPKDSLPNYSELYNSSNRPSYHSSSYYQSCPSFSWMENSNPYFSMHDSLYQLPPKLFEPKIVIDSTKSYSVSQSGYYGAETNGVPPQELGCSSNLLPNVPQLGASHESRANVSSPWNQSSFATTYPNRVQFSSTDMYPYEQNGLANESCDFPAADNRSISAEIDSASDADNRSLADDIADFLNMDSIDQNPEAMDLLISSEFPRGEQSSSTLRNEQTFYSGSSYGNYANANSSTNDVSQTATWPQSSQNVDANAPVTLPGSQTLLTANNGFQLPMFSSLLRESNTLTTAQNGVNCQDSGYAGADGTLSSINNVDTCVQRMEDDSYPDDQSQNVYSEIIDLDASPEAPAITAAAENPSFDTLPDTTRSHERTELSVGNTYGCDETEPCDDVVIVEPQPNSVATTSLMPVSNACRQNAEASGLMFKKQMLRRSKIMCDSTAVVHKYVKIFIPAEGKKTIYSQTTTRQKILDKVPSTSSNARQILKAHLDTRACWYKSVGCTFEARAQLVATHEKKCKFQAVYCPSESCSWREAFNGLIGHINDVHKEQVLDRQQFLYTIDRMANKSDRSFYTFYQIHKGTIYVIRVHIDEDKCVATVQYIPDTQGSSIRMRNLRGIMEFVAFPEKRRVKTWKGFIQPYSDTIDKRHNFNTIRIDMGDSEFIALYVCIC